MARSDELVGAEVVDLRGESVGRVRQVYGEAGTPTWVGVRAGVLGTAETLVPLTGATVADDTVRIPVPRERVRAAPKRRPDAPLRDDERRWLEAHYGDEVPVLGDAAAVPDGPELTRSEERLAVSTEPVPTTRVRLRKVVVTEQQTITVAVRHEELVIEREAIEDGLPDPEGAIGEAERELVLYEERVVVTKEVVPVERVRLTKRRVSEDREVTGEVRKERIELDEGGAPPAPPEAGAPAAPAPQGGTRPGTAVRAGKQR
ncbi:PRC and DUF2382 domain-containing protein [Amnibacterium sp. CER49]|uniref:PRC and DUF2382 domain-containing protein n=1 Tax=Amnibacterium sp. CER49 TaxID=3039161 RepID=UPI0024470D3D|nr:PRC and DUF2382 domain-containing protein [Amnibacterium sp. CER49]MDH2445492.1 PRC and DUF2382 domain-containing protein [Amnibacterium sp. CER49]